MVGQAGRYSLESILGRGGFSDVWRAQAADGHVVAIKWLREAQPGDAARIGRELGALSLLDLPGVVRLLDHGVHENRPFFVMDLVEGDPFPGPRNTWDQVEPVLRRLLATLARVHTAGLVHRDLKPANVLVTASGEPVILDFGLVRGSVLGTRLTASGAVMGTPAYLSPEQLNGSPCDERADLYAIGVMLYEALAGALPHTFTNLPSLWVERLTKEAPPLEVEGVPDLVRQIVSELLCRDPRGRPPDAGAVLRRLERGPRSLPWLGTTRLRHRLLTAAGAGESMDVVGPPGSGKSRYLNEFRQTLQEMGRSVVDLVPSSQAFGSMPSTWLEQGPDNVLDVATLHLSAGGVIAIDQPDALDRWTVRLLDDLRQRGCVVTARTSRAEANIPPLQPADLRDLFVGSDRVFRLRSDAAEELFRRTGGIPRRIELELRSWVAHGLATRVDDRFALSRRALDRLLAGEVAPVRSGGRPELEPELQLHLDWTAWVGDAATCEVIADVAEVEPWRVSLERETLVELGLIDELPGTVRVNAQPAVCTSWTEAQRREAHLRTAHVLAAGTRGRLEHAVGAGEPDLVSDAAVEYLEACAERGAHNEGLAWLSRVARAGLALPRAGELATLAVVMATSLGTRDDADRLRDVLVALGQFEGPHEMLSRVLQALSDEEHDAARALLASQTMDVGSRLEAARLELLVRTAMSSSDAAFASTVEPLAPGQDRGEPSWMRAKRHSWLGVLRFRTGAFQEAATHHEQALTLRSWRSERVSSLLNLSTAALWAGQPDRARLVARDALDIAAEIRHHQYVGRAEVRLRAVACRQGGTNPDLELAKLLDWDSDLLWMEAMMACRGKHPAAPDLVERARQLATRLKRRVQILHCKAMQAYLGLRGWHDVDMSEVPAPMVEDVQAMRDGGSPAPAPLSGVLR